MPTEQCRDNPAFSLLMVAYNFPPAATAGVHRPLRFTKYLSEFGCQPSVLTRNCNADLGGTDLLTQVPTNVVIHRVGKSPSPPSIPTDQGNSPKPPVDSKSANRLLAGVKNLLRPPWELITETPDHHIGWSRLASKHAVELCKSQNYDAIYTTGPPHSAHFVGMAVQQKLGIPWIADFRDPWARHNWVKTRNPWGRRLVPYYEKKVIHGATRVILNNETSRDEFRQTYPELASEKFVALPNGFDPELQETVLKLQRQAGNVSTPSHRPPVICHPGSLYRQREPRPILQAIKLLRDQGLEVCFQQIGHAAEENNPVKIAAELGIQDLVSAVPKVSHTEALRLMSEADILMIIQPHAQLQVPGKLYEMLLFDSPIIAVCDSQATTSVLESAEATWSANSHDVASIATAIRNAIAACTPTTEINRREMKTRYNGRNLSGGLQKIVASTIREFSPKPY